MTVFVQSPWSVRRFITLYTIFRTKLSYRQSDPAYLYDFSYEIDDFVAATDHFVRYFVQITAADKVERRLFLPPYNHQLNSGKTMAMAIGWIENKVSSTLKGFGNG